MSASDSKHADFLKTSRGDYRMAIVTRGNMRAQSQAVIATIACWAKEPGRHCACCDAKFTGKRAKPAAILVLTPLFASITPVVCGVCGDCHSTGDIRVKALLSWRKVREIEGGRA
jgi:hypothetical protein